MKNYIAVKKLREKSLRLVELCDDIKGFEHLRQLQKQVGGYIESVDVPALKKQGIDVYCNEEALEIEGNEATLIFLKNDEIIDVVMGDLVFCTYNEEGKTLALSKKQLDFLDTYVKNNSYWITSLFGERLPVIGVHI